MAEKDVILIVEDKESMATMLKETLESSGFETLIAGDGAEAIDTLSSERYDLVLTDLKLPKKDGIEVLQKVREEHPMVPVIVMTAFGTIETAVEAMKIGANDFIAKPFDTDHLILLINRALERQRLYRENILLREEFFKAHNMPAIIGKTPVIEDVADKVQKVARGKTTVLLLGESGTGKELFARAVHNLSGRKDYPFVPINCAAIPRDLLESELFGHEKGAFTGADAKKIGKFELADRGTVFLDEVGELDISLQAKLLRVLQEGEIERVGGVKQIKVDVRIIAASNRDLDEAVGVKEFREDLYYRLSVFPVKIPPLRDRKDDIPLLAEFFLDKYCAELNRKKKTISKEAMDVLMKYVWKGNVRELENAIERAIILCEGNEIGSEHITLRPAKGDEPDLEGLPMDGTLEDTSRGALKIAESKRIRKALDDVRWNKTKAAEVLGVSYKTLLTKIKDYGLELDT